jgi:hypothetical protein
LASKCSKSAYLTKRDQKNTDFHAEFPSVDNVGKNAPKEFSDCYSPPPLLTVFTPPPPPPPAPTPVCNVRENIVYGNLKSENSQDYFQKPQRNCTFMNSASGIERLRIYFLWKTHNTEDPQYLRRRLWFNSQTDEGQLPAELGNGHRSSFLL